MILRENKYGGYIFVRTTPGNTEATLKSLENICQQLNPAYPFQYSFLDEDLANLYKGEERIGSLFNVFAILAIFISCLGLYGLSAFIAEQRTKEIGVRKALGASVFNIVYLLSSNFTRVILIAIIVAIPISWYVVHNGCRDLHIISKLAGGFLRWVPLFPYSSPGVLLVLNRLNRRSPIR